MRASILIRTLAAATALLPSVSSAADAVPKFNISANCKAELAGGSGIGETLESCINDEQQARGQLAQQWARFYKAACIHETSIDGTPSYSSFRPALRWQPTQRRASETENDQSDAIDCRRSHLGPNSLGNAGHERQRRRHRRPQT